MATVNAARHFGIPVDGTMAHSFIQAHDDENHACFNFARAHPHSGLLLIDMDDTEAAALTNSTSRMTAAGAPINGSGGLGLNCAAPRIHPRGCKPER